MKTSFKEYFNYTRPEKRGIILLVVLIIIVFIVPTLHEKFKPETIIDFSEFEAQLNQFESNITAKEQEKEQNTTISYFYFDPNNIDKEGLIRLGFSKRQASNLINYRKAGGVFSNPTDLKKIYSIDSTLFRNIKPYIQINIDKEISETPQLSKKIPEEQKANSYESLIIELNTADSVDLIKLPGIGKVMARRIIDYRNFLGGFYQKEQLLEVFGLNKETYNNIDDLIIIDAIHINKININTVEFKTLNKHPYMSYANTKAIFKYRQLMGGFLSTTEIIENHLVDTATYIKIKNYVHIE